MKKYISFLLIALLSFQALFVQTTNAIDENDPIFGFPEFQIPVYETEHQREFEEDKENEIAPGFSLLSSNAPIAVDEIKHTFGDLKDQNNYSAYIKYGSRRYDKNTSYRGTFGNDFIESKVVDNLFFLHTKESYQYGEGKPKRFYGSMKTNFASTQRGWGQHSVMHIKNPLNNKRLFYFALYTAQQSGVSYSNSRGGKFCKTYTGLDESYCNSGYQQGHYAYILYQKENGNYSQIKYKLPKKYTGINTVDFSIDWSLGEGTITVTTPSNVSDTMKFSLETLSKPGNMQLNHFVYEAYSHNTNNQNQRTYPIELGLEMESNIPLSPTNFTTTTITESSIEYTWTDNATDNNQETKYILKDENNAIIQDDITADSTTFTENGLMASTNYTRKICAVNESGESCSELITTTTGTDTPPNPISDEDEEKVTNFNVAGLNIEVRESLNTFTLLFTLAGFRIHFVIEKI